MTQREWDKKVTQYFGHIMARRELERKQAKAASFRRAAEYVRNKRTRED